VIDEHRGHPQFSGLNASQQSAAEPDLDIEAQRIWEGLPGKLRRLIDVDPGALIRGHAAADSRFRRNGQAFFADLAARAEDVLRLDLLHHDLRRSPIPVSLGGWISARAIRHDPPPVRFAALIHLICRRGVNDCQCSNAPSSK